MINERAGYRCHSPKRDDASGPCPTTVAIVSWGGKLSTVSRKHHHATIGFFTDTALPPCRGRARARWIQRLSRAGTLELGASCPFPSRARRRRWPGRGAALAAASVNLDVDRITHSPTFLDKQQVHEVLQGGQALALRPMSARGDSFSAAPRQPVEAVRFAGLDPRGRGNRAGP